MRYSKAKLLLPLAIALLYISACSNTQPPADYNPPIENTIDTENATANIPGVDLPICDSIKATESLFEGKIAIITDEFAGSFNYISAYPLVDRYSTEKVLHIMWPINHYKYSEVVINNIILDLGSNPEIKAIIIAPPHWRISAALEKLREVRSDIYVICVVPHFLFDEESGYLKIADLILMTDSLKMGSVMAEQAKKLGAETFIYYSFPQYISGLFNTKRHDLIKTKCADLGIEFVYANIIDPMSGADFNTDGVEQFILDDVPKMIKKYGKNTAFFSADCAFQAQLIKTVLDIGAIYPQPCCLYPFHGYPNVYYEHVMEMARGEYFDFGYEYMPYKNDFTKCIEVVIAQLKTSLEGKGDLSRLSTWPVFDDFMYASTAAEYAIKWINGEVPKEGVDVDVLKQLMEEYAGVNVYLTPFVDDGTYDFHPRESEPTGETYENFLLMRMDYVTFEELGVK